jgi:hypothetical protein
MVKINPIRHADKFSIQITNLYIDIENVPRVVKHQHQKNNYDSRIKD